jgi:hypothetical protein
MSLTTRVLDSGIVRATRASLLGFALALAACKDSANADRTAVLERADAARLTGTWDITLILERSIALRDSARGHERMVAGTIAFTENRSSDLEAADFGVVTHKGVYDLDLSSFRLPPASDSHNQVAIARTAVVHPAQGNIAGDDSLFVVLNPGDSQLSVRLTGTLAGDTIAGSWVAEFVRSQASGRFVMRRHRA